MLLARIASDAVLDDAYEWLCHRRRDYPADADVWSFRRIEKGFDFLGYHFSRDGLTVAKATIERFLERAARLYEQERERPEGPTWIGKYVPRWNGWAGGYSGGAKISRLKDSFPS